MLSHLFNIFIIYIQQEYHCQGWVEYVWVRLKAMATTKVYFCRSEEVSTWRGREDDPVGHCWFCSKYYHPASSCKKTDYNDRCSQEWGGQITIMKQSLSNNISWHCHGFKSSCYRSMVLILANVSLHKLPFLWPHSSEALSLHFWTASKVLDLLHSRIGVTIMICIAANWFYHKLLCTFLWIATWLLIVTVGGFLRCFPLCCWRNFFCYVSLAFSCPCSCCTCCCCCVREQVSVVGRAVAEVSLTPTSLMRNSGQNFEEKKESPF